jgi:integrase/recombinase XerD
MPTFKIVQRRIKLDGTGEINIRVTHNRKIVYVRMGYYVNPSQLKDGIVTKHPNAALLNMKIEEKKSELLQNILRQDLLGEEININKATGNKPERTETMFGAIKHVMNRYQAQNMAASFNRMKTNFDYIQQAWNEKDMYITDIKKTDVEKFVNHRYKQGNSASTVKKNLSDLAAVLNHIGYKGDNLFTDYAKSIKAFPVHREKLSFEEIKLLENIKLKGMADIARDMFLFSFYAHGMRFESVATLSISDIRNSHICYRMNKGKKLREIFIHPKLKTIIDKYIDAKTLYLFPVVKVEHNAWNKKEIIGRANALVRNFLIAAAHQAGIEKHIHFHQARHTFAYLSKTKNVSVNVIQDALGHTKASTTEGYLKSLSDDLINDAVKSVYE